jgi:plastocyanin
MKLTHITAGFSLIALAACGGSDTPAAVTPPAVQTLSTIRFPTPTVALTAGATSTLVPEALDATGKVIPGVTGYTFASSASTIAESRGAGVVLAIGAGSSTITASLTRDGKTATSTATVTVTGTLPAAATVAAGTDRLFTPASLVVAKNANVTFAIGSLTHNVTFRAAGGAPADIGNTSSSNVPRAFATAGDYTYDCTLHAGMTGTVVVR